MRHPMNKHTPKRRMVRFPGIMTDADLLGVDRSSLYRALLGQRHTPKLLARYRALKKAQKAEASK